MGCGRSFRVAEIPDTYGLVTGGGGHVAAIGRKGDGTYDRFVPSQHVHKRSQRCDVLQRIFDHGSRLIRRPSVEQHRLASEQGAAVVICMAGRVPRGL